MKRSIVMVTINEALHPQQQKGSRVPGFQVAASVPVFGLEKAFVISPILTVVNQVILSGWVALRPKLKT
jgi:hypothetical protein